MNEFFNFHDTWIVAEANWFWLIVGFGLGVWVGWQTAGLEKSNA